MVFLGLEPSAAGLKASTSPLSYGGHPQHSNVFARYIEIVMERCHATVIVRIFSYQLKMPQRANQVKQLPVNSRISTRKYLCREHWDREERSHCDVSLIKLPTVVQNTIKCIDTIEIVLYTCSSKKISMNETEKSQKPHNYSI